MIGGRRFVFIHNVRCDCFNVLARWQRCEELNEFRIRDEEKIN